MTKVDELEVLISANVQGFKRELDIVKRQLGALQSSTNNITKKVSASAVAMGGAIAGIVSNVFSKLTSAVGSQVDSAIGRLDTLNNFPRVMANLGVSSNDATKAINVLSERLNGLPVKLDEASLGVQRFTAANENIGASVDMYLAMRNAMLAGGASAEMQTAAMEQLMQAYSKGKPEAEEWKSMLQAMPAQLKQIATDMGYTSTAIGGDFQQALVNGDISMNDFMMTAIKLNKTGANGFASFEEQARTATGGVATSIERVQTAFSRGIATIMDTIGQSNIAGFFNAIVSVIDHASIYIAAFVKIIKEAIAWISILFGNSGSTSGMVKSTSEASKNLDGAASGASNIASGLDNTNKSAKKLTKQLAGFDEMNVLQDNSGSGGESATGGGGIVIPDYDWDTSGITNGTDQVAKAVKNLKKIFHDLFGSFDLNKIINAFRQFGEDINKLLTPAKRILNEVWNDYLRPFVNWAGNDLLPGFLNAIGGAISLIGEVLGRFWDRFLKPFIDVFLVPIAQFTGGAIVTVLNAIGDALRWLSQQDAAVEVISALIAGFATYQVISKASNALNKFMDAFTIAKQGIPSAQAAIEASGRAFAKMGSIVGGAGTTIKSFGGIISNLASAIFSPATIVTLALVAAFEAFQVAMEYNKLKTMEAKLAEELYKTTEESVLETTEWHNDSIQRQIDLKKELEGITKNVADANLSLLNAQEAFSSAQNKAESIAKQYGMTLQEAKIYVDNLDIASGNLSEKDKELAQSVFDLNSKEQAVKDSIDKVTEAKSNLSEKTEELSNQQWKEIMSQQKAEAEALLAAGKYDELSRKIISLKDSNGEFTLANGENCKFTKEQMQSMAEFVGDQLATIDDSNGVAWRNIWDKADRTVANLRNTTIPNLISGLAQGGLSAGISLSDGILSALNNKQSQLNGAIGRIGNSMLGVFKGTFQIHSPSRVMKKMGAYITEGLGLGILSENKTVESAVTRVGDTIQGTIGCYQLDVDSIISGISSDILRSSINIPNIHQDINSQIQNEIDVNERPIQLLLKIDSENIPISATRITELLNDSTFLNNRNLLSI